MERRLDTVERKLDNISGKLDAIVRLEERHISSTQRIDALESRVNHQGKAMDQFAIDLTKNTTSTSFLERAGWSCFAVLIGAVGYFFRG